MLRSAAEMTWSYFLSRLLRVKTYDVLMKNFSVSCGIVG